MAREIDESWVEEAIARYRRIEAGQAEFSKALQTVEVTVRSADGAVEVVVAASGEIRDVVVTVPPASLTQAGLSRSIRSAVLAATDAARWAREKLHADTFGGYPPLQES